MTNSWSEKGLNFEALMPIKEIKKLSNIQVVSFADSLESENDQDDCEDIDE